MVSLLSSLNMSAGALSVNEKAISVVSHNVSNMNTEGYHKQRANLVTRNIAGTIGDSVYNQARANGGVKIANIMRYNDEYLTNYYRSQISEKYKLSAQLDGLGDLANILNDLEGTGIDAALSKFYESLNNLHEYPASSTARINFIETAKTLCSTMNGKYKELQQNTTQALGDGSSDESLKNSKIYSQFGVFNDKLEELAAVNKALQTTQTGTLEANNLLDRRDLILNDIAQFTDITVVEKENGSVSVYTNDVALVKGAKVVGELSIQTAEQYCISHPPLDYKNWTGENAVISIVNPETKEVTVSNANSIITSGTLGGLLHFATDNDGENGINAGTVMKGLDDLTNTIAKVFNKLNTRNGAYCINPQDTEKLMKVPQEADEIKKYYIFSSIDGDEINAGNIQVNPELLTDEGCWKLACAYFDDPANFDENAVGNAQNVTAMLETRNEKQAALKGMSIEDFYTGLVGKVAAAGSNIQSLYDTQDDLLESIETKIKNATGVDLNEELVDLVKYQTAYKAAAQVFNACNNCLDTLMSLGR